MDRLRRVVGVETTERFSTAPGKPGVHAGPLRLTAIPEQGKPRAEQPGGGSWAAARGSDEQLRVQLFTLRCGAARQRGRPPDALPVLEGAPPAALTSLEGPPECSWV